MRNVPRIVGVLALPMDTMELSTILLPWCARRRRWLRMTSIQRSPLPADAAVLEDVEPSPTATPVLCPFVAASWGTAAIGTGAALVGETTPSTVHKARRTAHIN